MGNLKQSQTIAEEVQARYETSFEALANRCLGEPYNFHRVAPILGAEILKSDLLPAKIVSACLDQFLNKDGYTPQSIGLATGLAPSFAVEMSMRDCEMTIGDAMEAFLLYHGQWAELKISDYAKSWVMRGLTSEEIQSEYAKARKSFGLSARLNSSDGKEDFEKRLLAAIDGITFDFPVRPSIKKIQKLIPFYEPGDYIVVGALTGNGKTYYALNQIYQLSLSGVPSCCINLENTPANMQKRIWQMHSKTWFKPDLRGSDEQMRHYLHSWNEVKEMPFRSYNPGPELPAVLAAIRQDWHERSIQFAVVDYAQLMSVPGYSGGRNYELGVISAAFRALALELQIPIMVLAQFKQEVSKTGDKRGGLYDIKDCANFAQDATIMQSLYRPSIFDIFVDSNGQPYAENYADVSICKGRESGTAQAECRFDHIRGFYDIEEVSEFVPQDVAPIDFSQQRPKPNEDIPF
jgi:hypothetical protein